MTHLSLCSGIGGIDLAAEWAGFETVAVCEIDPECRKVLARNFPRAYQFENVTHVTTQSLQNAGIDTPTLISAGFPCQPFSIAGKRQGTGDERHLWPEIARILREVRPRWFLGENVRGLLSIKTRSGYPRRIRRARGIPRVSTVFGDILRDLASMGYRAGWGCYGVDEAARAPHCRDRVFIVGYLADACSQRRKREPVLLQQRGDCPETTRGGNTVAGKRNLAPFPPGPADLEQWSTILADRPDLAPALTPDEEIELQVQPVAHGISRRLALKMAGNAVSPYQVLPILQEIAEYERRDHA